MSRSVEREQQTGAVVEGGSAPRRPLGVAQQLALSSYWFANFFHWGALLLLVIPVQAKWIQPANSAGAIAAVFGLPAFVALIVPLIVGMLSDRSMSRFGRRRPYMMFGTIVNLAGLAVMAAGVGQRNLLLYVIGYSVVQFGNNTAGAAYAGIIPDMVPVKQHGEASGYMGAMTQAGMILGAFAAGKLLGGHPDLWLIYGVLGAILIIFMLVTLATVHETPLTVKPPPITAKGFIRALIDPLKSRDFLWVLVTRALVTLGMWCVQPFIPNYLGDVVHVKDEVGATSLVIAIILGSATVTGLIGGKISDRVGRKAVVYVANTMIAICSIAFVFSHSLIYTIVIGALYGLGYGAYYSVDWALACDTLPNMEDAGKDMGIWHISLVLPQTVAPAIAGFVLANVGHSVLVNGTRHYSVLGYQVAFTMAAVFLMLGALFLRNVRDRRERELAAAAQAGALPEAEG